MPDISGIPNEALAGGSGAMAVLTLAVRWYLSERRMLVAALEENSRVLARVEKALAAGGTGTDLEEDELRRLVEVVGRRLGVIEAGEGPPVHPW